jgi:hypothetical protein
MGKNQDPGSGINIPDPQHCIFMLTLTVKERSAHARLFILSDVPVIRFLNFQSAPF